VRRVDLPKESVIQVRAQSARRVLLAALWTCLCLGGTLSLPFWAGLVIYELRPDVNQSHIGRLLADAMRQRWQPIVALPGVAWAIALGLPRGA
jgi:hypothetical protein